MEFVKRVMATGPSRLALVLRLAAGGIFVAFSFGKFIHYEAERNAFDRYGIPFVDVTTYLIDVVELVGGLALVVGFLTRPAALALAGNMIGAISTAGRIEGGWIHLGLAPALLVTMLILLWTGGGAASVDRWLQRRNDGPGRVPAVS